MNKISKKTLDCLRLVIYHKLLMWEAASQAEEVLWCDLDCESDSLNSLAVGIVLPGDAIDLSEERLLEAFGLEGKP